jgi:hypothetical protein
LKIKTLLLAVFTVSLISISNFASAMPKYAMFTVYYSDETRNEIVGWKYNSCFIGGQNGGGDRTAFSDVDVYTRMGTCSSIGFDPWSESSAYSTCTIPLRDMVYWSANIFGTEYNIQTKADTYSCFRNNMR